MSKKINKTEQEYNLNRHNIKDNGSIEYEVKKHDRQKHVDKKVDVVKALRYRLYHKLSYREIAEKFNCHHSAVQRALEPFLVFLEQPPQVIDAYQQFEAFFVSVAKLRLLEFLIRRDKLEKATVNQIAYALAQLDHIYRLSTNQATENIDIKALNISLHELKKQRKELEVELSLISKQIEELPEEDENVR